MFTFGYYDGNVGNEIAFDTYEEALAEARMYWNHLTHKEKKRTTDGKEGAYFCVFEGGNDIDNCKVVKDFAEELEE